MKFVLSVRKLATSSRDSEREVCFIEQLKPSEQKSKLHLNFVSWYTVHVFLSKCSFYFSLFFNLWVLRYNVYVKSTALLLSYYYFYVCIKRKHIRLQKKMWKDHAQQRLLLKVKNESKSHLNVLWCSKY